MVIRTQILHLLQERTKFYIPISSVLRKNVNSLFLGNKSFAFITIMRKLIIFYVESAFKTCCAYLHLVQSALIAITKQSMRFAISSKVAFPNILHR